MTETPLTYDQICDFVDSENRDDKFYAQKKLVWLAMTDWPTGLENTDELIKELSGQIKKSLTKVNLEDYDKELSKNFGRPGNGWKAEAVASLIELFQYYPTAKTLEEVINLFTQTIANKLNAADK